MRTALSSSCYPECGRMSSCPPALHSTSLSPQPHALPSHLPPQGQPSRLPAQPESSRFLSPPKPPVPPAGRCHSFFPASWFYRSRSPASRQHRRRRLDSGKAGSHAPIRTAQSAVRLGRAKNVLLLVILSAAKNPRISFPSRSISGSKPDRRCILQGPPPRSRNQIAYLGSNSPEVYGSRTERARDPELKKPFRS
jgi:hypothetical protein